MLFFFFIFFIFFLFFQIHRVIQKEVVGTFNELDFSDCELVFFPLSLDSETAEADTSWSKIYRVIDKPIKCAREQITGRVVAKM